MIARFLMVFVVAWTVMPASLAGMLCRSNTVKQGLNGLVKGNGVCAKKAVTIPPSGSKASRASALPPKLPRKRTSATSGKDAKQAIKVEPIETRLVSQARSVRVIKPIIDTKSPEKLYMLLHEALAKSFGLFSKQHTLPTDLEAWQMAERSVVNMLRRKNIDNVDAVRNEMGQTALHLAVDYGDLPVVGVLLRMGAQVRAQDNVGLTALHYAAYNGDVAIVAKLLQHDADAAIITADAETMRSFTPLHWLLYNHAALESKQIEAVARLLVQANADVLTMLDNKEGRLPIHMSAAAGLNKLVIFFLEVAKPYEDEGKVPEDECTINDQDLDGWTPLHHAIFNNCGDVVVTLLKNGALVTLRDKWERTPAALAKQCGKIQMAALLEQVEKSPNMTLTTVALPSKAQFDAAQQEADLLAVKNLISSLKS